MSDGLWRGVVPPFRMLDPALRDAEALLTTALAEVCAVLPDERGATRRLNRVLRAAAGPPQLARDARGWRIVVGGRDPTAAAAAALATLVVAGGWRRLKRCARCGAPFVDRTNGVSRRGCDEHKA
jgi:predicted RNA-binding Zn ribbon-like protein